MCTIKLVNNKWRCYSQDGEELCAYTVKAWAVMFAEFHGLKITEQKITSVCKQILVELIEQFHLEFIYKFLDFCYNVYMSTTEGELKNEENLLSVL